MLLEKLLELGLKRADVITAQGEKVCQKCKPQDELGAMDAGCSGPCYCTQGGDGQQCIQGLCRVLTTLQSDQFFTFFFFF